MEQTSNTTEARYVDEQVDVENDMQPDSALRHDTYSKEAKCTWAYL